MYHEKERAESALSDFFLAMKKGHHGYHGRVSSGCQFTQVSDFQHRNGVSSRVSGLTGWYSCSTPMTPASIPMKNGCPQ